MAKKEKKIYKRVFDLQTEEWLKEHGYTFKYIRQYPIRTDFEIEREGIINRLSVSANIENFNLYMDLMEGVFEKQRKAREA
jgi:hypothetical protein